MHVYDKYVHLLKSEAVRKVEKFIGRQRGLPSYVKEIDSLKGMASSLASMPVYVPMNFFLLNCDNINKVLVMFLSWGDGINGLFKAVNLYGFPVSLTDFC